MVSNCDRAERLTDIKVPFTPEEAARFRAYLAREDKKAGRFVRTLILRALDADEAPAGAQP